MMEKKIFLFSVLSLALAVGLVFAGYKLGQRQVQPGIVGVPTPFITPLPTPTPDPTANWKTYTNTKYGYSIKYPSDYVVGSCRNCPDLFSVDFITFDPPQPAGYGRIMVSKLRDREQAQTAEQYLEEISGIDSNPVVPGSKIRFRVNSYEALTTTTANYGYENKNIFLLKENQGFHMSFTGVASLANKGFLLKDYKNINIFDLMLSTLRFLSPESLVAMPTPTPGLTANWKTYRNEKYGFKVKYSPVYQLKFLKENLLCFEPPGSEWCSIEIWPGYLGGSSLETYIQTELGLPKDRPLIEFLQELAWEYSWKQINDRSWLYFHQAEGPGEGRYHNFVRSNDVVVDIMALSSETQKSEEFDLMLSIFRFLE